MEPCEFRKYVGDSAGGCGVHHGNIRRQKMDLVRAMRVLNCNVAEIGDRYPRRGSGQFRELAPEDEIVREEKRARYPRGSVSCLYGDCAAGLTSINPYRREARTTMALSCRYCRAK